VTDLDEGHRTIDASSFPLVVKADGLAQGKGVVVAPDRDTAHEALEALLGAKTFGEAGSRVLLETCLTGPEVSAFALTDGQRILGLPFVQDHKRLNPGDTGPNTGGMGAVTDPAFLPPDASSEVAHTIFRPVLRAMRRRHTPFRGILYAGLMWTQKGPMVLEFNVRMGDPEAEALLPGLTGDLAAAFHAAASGTLDGVLLGRRSGFGVSVVAVAEGYPLSPVLGDPIEYDPASARSDDSFLFHAGTVHDASGILRVSGGRVVVAAAWKSTRNDAKRLAYEHLSRLSFPGMHVRQDIGDTAGEDVQM
jgi:phosphoribosylamine--glycine ligase